MIADKGWFPTRREKLEIADSLIDFSMEIRDYNPEIADYLVDEAMKIYSSTEESLRGTGFHPGLNCLFLDHLKFLEE